MNVFENGALVCVQADRGAKRNVQNGNCIWVFLFLTAVRMVVVFLSTMLGKQTGMRRVHIFILLLSL